MRSTPTARVALAALAVIVLAACGQETAPPTSSPSASASRAPAADPTALVGSWLVTDAKGAEPGTVLRVADDLSLWQACGYLMGSWRAGGVSLFAASLDGGDPGCVPEKGDPTPSWLAAAADYAVDASGVTLLAADGTVVARLRAGGRPTPGPNLLPSLADPPVLTDALRTQLAAGKPLPSSLAPATRAALVGSWVSALPRPSSSGLSHDVTPEITLHADGTYTGTDGCNGTSGRWNADDSGALVVTSGPSTLVGCDNVAVGQWLAAATAAGFDGKVLVLVGKDGAETGRLTRA
jgi:hypothetical protein